MIYAGGKGVTPSLPLAIRFACEIQDWNGDGREVGKMLDAKRRDGATRVDFDICERPTGRQMNYICILCDQNRANIRIEDAEKRLKSAAPLAQRSAFERVLAARKAYLDVHQSEEPSGNTGLVQTAMRDQVAIDDSWAQALDDYTAGKLPHYSASDFNKADVDLNAAYRNALKRTASSGDGVDSLSVDQLVKAERAWIAYRDAWVAYAGLRWPPIAADSWRTWLTLERTAMLASD